MDETYTNAAECYEEILESAAFLRDQHDTPRGRHRRGYERDNREKRSLREARGDTSGRYFQDFLGILDRFRRPDRI